MIYEFKIGDLVKNLFDDIGIIIGVDKSAAHGHRVWFHVQRCSGGKFYEVSSHLTLLAKAKNEL